VKHVAKIVKLNLFLKREIKPASSCAVCHFKKSQPMHWDFYFEEAIMSALGSYIQKARRKCKYGLREFWTFLKYKF
jgi:hypothetical protein